MRKTLVGLATLAVAAAGVVTGGTGQAAAAGGPLALWNMNEAPGSTVLVDSSGHGLNGTIGTSIALSGTDHTFPKISRGDGGTVDPQHLDLIDSPALNPGTSDFSVTVRLRIPSLAASLGNVMQKGQTGTPGGFWKLQLDAAAGHVICEFVSPTKSGGVRSAQIVADNQWHTVTCERSATEVTTTVDGITTRIASAVGNIANNEPLSIGGKFKCSATAHHDCDYFIGSMDYVEIQTGAAAAAAPGAFAAVGPARVLDTRTGLGAVGPVAAGATVHLPVLGVGGVPSSGVAAVVLNLTATAGTSAGFVTAYPDTGARPVASNLNYLPGQVAANLVVVPVGTDGKVALYNGSAGSAQLIADMAGYYAGGTASMPGAFVAVGPARVLDTRTGLGAAGPVAAGATVHLPVLGAGGVPSSGVAAVVLNLTATAGTSAGFVTAYPDTGARPVASNLNYLPGQVAANLVVVPVGTDGKVALYNGSAGTAQLIADMAGYYLAGGAAAPGAFAAVGPARVLDTRTGLGAAGPVAAGATVHLPVLGVGGVPSSGVVAVVLNLTAAATASPGFVTAYPDTGARPVTSNLNYRPGQVVANLVVVPVGTDGKVALYNGSAGTAQLIADVAGYYLG